MTLQRLSLCLFYKQKYTLKTEPVKCVGLLHFTGSFQKTSGYLILQFFIGFSRFEFAYLQS